MYDDLKDKRVVITGGASGIGYATTKRFIEEGCKVIVLDCNQAALDEALSDMPKLSGVVCADVSKPDDIKAAFQKIDALMGGIDILISNAGISVRTPFTDIDYTQWTKVLQVNLDGMFLCARAAIKRMKKQGAGVILFTASTNGAAGYPYYTDYNASKAGVINLAKTIALECAPWLRINAICPGYVLTPMQKAEYTPEMLDAVNARIPLGRHAEPEEIAALFAFLASSEARYITGTTITIDGGETAGTYIPMED
ncbi:MAG: SDR family oxidoreductase [Desulfobacterales bacterium]|jgi:NAD(P)-dependent dehydrogenase (short-subunit alcohol dehydrogenase family)